MVLNKRPVCAPIIGLSAERWALNDRIVADLEAIRELADRGVQHVYIVVGERTIEAAKARLHDIAEHVLGRL